MTYSYVDLKSLLKQKKRISTKAETRTKRQLRKKRKKASFRTDDELSFFITINNEKLCVICENIFHLLFRFGFFYLNLITGDKFGIAIHHRCSPDRHIERGTI